MFPSMNCKLIQQTKIRGEVLTVVGLEGTDEAAGIRRRLFRGELWLLDAVSPAHWELRLLDAISPAANRDPNHMVFARRPFHR
jgi:hypothetical protein